MNRIPLVVSLALLGASPARAQTVRTVTLREAVSAALARSPRLAVAEASRDESAAGSRLARKAFRPEAALTATPGYASGLPVAVAGQVPAIGGVDLRQTLYDPNLRASALEAQAGEAGRAGDLDAARAEAARSVVALYARCRADRAQQEAASLRVAGAQEILRHVEARRKEGRETDLAVERASLTLARARQTQLDAASESDLDDRELKAAIGIPAAQEIALPDEPSAVRPRPELDSEAILARDPVLRSLEQQRDILDALRRTRARSIAPVVQAEAQYWRLSSNYERYYKRFKADDWSVAVAVGLPIFSGGRFTEERLRSESAWKRVEAQVRERREALAVLVARRQAALVRATSSAALARRARGVAEETLRVAEALAREERGDADAPAARRADLADADDALARAELEQATAHADLLAAGGQLPAVFPAAAGAAEGEGTK